MKEPNPNYVPPASRKVYLACARGGGKSYEQFRQSVELMEQFDAAPWPKINPYLKGEKNMTYYEFMDNEIAALRAEVKTANEKNVKLVDDCIELETALQDAEERCKVKDAYIDELRMKLESAVSQNKCLNERVRELRDNRGGDAITIALGQQRIKELMAENDKLTKELSEVKERNENQFNTIQQLEKELKEYKAVVGDNPEAMKTYILENDERINKLRNDNKLLEMAMMDANANMSLISAQNKRLREQNEKYDLVIHTIEQLFGCAFDI